MSFICKHFSFLRWVTIFSSSFGLGNFSFHDFLVFFFITALFGNICTCTHLHLYLTSLHSFNNDCNILFFSPSSLFIPNNTSFISTTITIYCCTKKDDSIYSISTFLISNDTLLSSYLSMRYPQSCKYIENKKATFIPLVTIAKEYILQKQKEPQYISRVIHKDKRPSCTQKPRNDRHSFVNRPNCEPRTDITKTPKKTTGLPVFFVPFQVSQSLLKSSQVSQISERKGI